MSASLSYFDGMKDKRSKSIKQKQPVKKTITIDFFSPWLMIPSIVILTYLVFSHCRGFEVTNWDDNHYIRELLLIRSLAWDNIAMIFKTKVLLSYNPLVILSLAVDYAVGKNSPGWYHAVNVYLHIINSVLVLLVFRKLGVGARIAALCALLFAIHPMHVESVAWIASRKDVLFTFFFLLSWWAYLWYVPKEGERSVVKNYFLYGLSVLLFACSGFSKIQAVTLPLVLVLSDYLQRKQFSFRDLIDKIPFFLGSIAFGWYAVGSSSLKADKYATPVSFLEKVVYSFQAFGVYVFKCIAPVRQSAIYAFPQDGTSDYLFTLVSGIALAAAMILFVLRYWKKNLLMAFGLLFFMLNIFPTLHLVALNSSLIYERFTYVSYLGLFVCIAALPDVLSSRRAMLAAALTLCVIPLAVLAHQRTAIWKNSYTLWSDVIEKNSRSHEALNNRGAWYNDHGELDKALADFDASLALNPRQPRTYNNRSMIWFYKKDYQRSLQDIDSALSMEPKLAEAWCNRGNAYFDLQQFDTAIYNYSKALEYMPNFPSNYANRGSAYLKKGSYEEALKDYQTAISQAPNDGASWRLEALALAELNRHDEAEAAMQRAVALGQGDAGIMLGNEYLQMGLNAWNNLKKNPEVALDYYLRSAKANPANADAWYNIGGMYYVLKDLSKARENWRKALNLRPDYSDAKLWLERTGGV